VPSAAKSDVSETMSQYSYYVTFLPMLKRGHTTARSYTDDKRNERFGCSDEQLVPFKLT